MKIALVSHSFSLSHGGLERFSVNLATALHAEGHEVHAFAQRFADLPAGVTEHRLEVPRKPSFRRIFGFHRSAVRAVQGHSFDVVYGLARFAPLDVYRMGDGVQKHWMRIRYPFSPWRWLNYLINPTHLCNLYLERRILSGRDCRRIVTNSHLCAEHAQRYYGVPLDRIDVVYNGVNHQIFNPKTMAELRSEGRRELGLQDDDLALLHISNNWPRKGLSVLLRAVALLGDQGRHLHILVVGRGRPAPFRKLAGRLGLADRLHLVGETTQVQRYYAAGDLMVLPTLYDPFSNVCLEAMACGLAVVTTAENGASELIRLGENGYVQKNPRDVQELANCLGQCLNREALASMGAAARTTALPFTREKNMRETLAVFSRVLQEKQS
ncbi:glycosyltransferase family 4 protein [Trichloromonas sp.]|uniref:glycosyltransferase family 4 protein n=1 Tax=Trichloromonas sp. TaxID=3069249 RepID=UPI002A442519|nr:glycosyltransferase family 4 protein [Trichloromonas sp.]